MKYAIVSTGGKQFKVQEGDILELESLGLKAKDSYSFPQVLLVVDEGKTTFGTPLVSGAVVSATVLEEVKGDKVRVAKFKAKVRYRKVIGFRATISKVKIDKIALKANSDSKQAKKTS